VAQVTSQEAAVVFTSIRLNPVTITLSTAATTRYASTDATAFEAGGSASTSTSEDGGGAGIAVIMIVVVLVAGLVLAVAVRWTCAKRKHAEAESAATSNPHRTAVGHPRPPMPRPAATNLAFTQGTTDEADADPMYLEVSTVHHANTGDGDGDARAAPKQGEVIYDTVPSEIAKPTPGGGIKPGYSVVRKKTNSGGVGGGASDSDAGVAAPEPDGIQLDGPDAVVVSDA
jgi:hypothetical protein